MSRAPIKNKRSTSHFVTPINLETGSNIFAEDEFLAIYNINPEKGPKGRPPSSKLTDTLRDVFGVHVYVWSRLVDAIANHARQDPANKGSIRDQSDFLNSVRDTIAWWDSKLEMILGNEKDRIIGKPKKGKQTKLGDDPYDAKISTIMDWSRRKIGNWYGFTAEKGLRQYADRKAHILNPQDFDGFLMQLRTILYATSRSQEITYTQKKHSKMFMAGKTIPWGEVKGVFQPLGDHGLLSLSANTGIPVSDLWPEKWPLQHYFNIAAILGWLGREKRIEVPIRALRVIVAYCDGVVLNDKEIRLSEDADSLLREGVSRAFDNEELRRFLQTAKSDEEFVALGEGFKERSARRRSRSRRKP